MQTAATACRTVRVVVDYIVMGSMLDRSSTPRLNVAGAIKVIQSSAGIHSSLHPPSSPKAN